MDPNKTNVTDMRKLQTIFNNKSLAISDCIKKSLEIISQVTDYTSVILGEKSKDNCLKKVEVLPLDDTKVIAIVITDKGSVSHKSIDVSNISLDELSKTVELINKLLIGTPINEVNTKLEFEIKPIIDQYIKQHEAIYNAFYDVFSEFTSRNVSFMGKTNMLNQPEFNNIEKVKKIYGKLDKEETLRNISAKDGNINIYIGKESKVDDDVTIIKTKYKAGNEEGTIAIIGPKRMEYERVVNCLNFIKENIEGE